jgi:hypothetical protein
MASNLDIIRFMSDGVGSGTSGRTGKRTTA